MSDATSGQEGDTQRPDPTAPAEFTASTPPPPPPPATPTGSFDTGSPPPVAGSAGPAGPAGPAAPPPPPAFVPPYPVAPVGEPAAYSPPPLSPGQAGYPAPPPAPPAQMGFPAPPSGPPTGGPTGPLGGQPAPLVAGGDYTSAFAPQEIEEAKVLSILGYLGILFLVPMLAMPNNRFARFHANQGLVLFITWFACSIAQFALGYVPIIKWFTWILWLGPFVLMIIGMVNAGGGKAKALPLIGNFQLVR